MNTNAGSPWDVTTGDFPSDASEKEKLAYLVRFAVLAPSSHNTQPWVFEITDDDEIRLFADFTRSLPIADPDDRELIISCGAALYNLELAARHFGYGTTIRIRPELERPDLMAVIRLHPHAHPSDEESVLFRNIRNRHTNRLGFEDREVNEAVLHHLQAAVNLEGVGLAVVPAGLRAEAAELVAAGDRRLHADPRFRAELAKWLRPNKSVADDGIPGYALGLSDLAAAGGPFMIRTFNMGRSAASADARKAVTAPLLLVLETEDDTVEDWLAAGRALSRLLLTATQQGLTAAFLNQPIEVEDLRQRLAALIREPGYPQLMLYMGYADSAPPTPRRDPAEVVRMPNGR